MPNPLLSVENLNVSYKTERKYSKDNHSGYEVVKGVSFSINSSEIFGLIGESGCGKTTTAKAISGLLKHSGSIKLNGKDLASSSRKINSSRIQMIFQNPYNSLNPTMRIGRILEEPLIIHGYHSSYTRLEKVKAMLNIVGLDESYISRFTRELSGGERQRIAIGCALMLNPELIVADEILSALDVSVQSAILNMLSELNSVREVAFLFISHDINVVSYFCDRIAVMYKGEIVEVGNTVDVYNSPLHPYTAALIRSVPRIDKVIELDDPVLNEIPLHNQGCAYAKYCPSFACECLTIKISINSIDNRQVRCIKYSKGVETL